MWQAFGYSHLKGKQLRQLQGDLPQLSGYKNSILMHRDLGAADLALPSSSGGSSTKGGDCSAAERLVEAAAQVRLAGRG
jgi:hypothetical protein